MKAGCQYLAISVGAVISYLLPLTWGHGKGNNTQPRQAETEGGVGKGGEERVGE